jgi:hypothetical protein
MIVVWFLLAALCLVVTYKSLRKKMALNDRYWASLGDGIRNWDTGPIRDAQEAVSEEMGWTLLLIMAWCGLILSVIGFFGEVL